MYGGLACNGRSSTRPVGGLTSMPDSTTARPVPAGRSPARRALRGRRGRRGRVARLQLPSAASKADEDGQRAPPWLSGSGRLLPGVERWSASMTRREQSHSPAIHSPIEF